MCPCRHPCRRCRCRCRPGRGWRGCSRCRSPIAVLVDLVADDLRGTGEDGVVAVVAVEEGGGEGLAVVVAVGVVAGDGVGGAVAVVVGVGVAELLGAAVLVDAVGDDLGGAPVDAVVVVVAAVDLCGGAGAVAVAVDEAGLAVVAVLVDAVTGDLGGSREGGGVVVVAVDVVEVAVAVAIAAEGEGSDVGGLGGVASADGGAVSSHGEVVEGGVRAGHAGVDHPGLVVEFGPVEPPSLWSPKLS